MRGVIEFECGKEEEIDCILICGIQKKSSLDLSIMHIQLNELTVIVSLFEFS